jgi:hypothetical protein
MAAVLGLAGAAAAQQSSGTVDLTGNVAGSCSVTTGSLNGAINLSELAAADGTLRPALAGPAVAGAQVAFRVTCNTGAPAVAVQSTRLLTPAAAAAGYANAVDYTATVDISQTTGQTAVNYVTAASPPAASTTVLTRPLATTPDNVIVRVHNLSTPANAVLVAGDYAGAISITISPS